MSKFDKYRTLREKVRELFKESNARYGYRRIRALLIKENIRMSEKVIRRLMKEEELAGIGKFHCTRLPRRQAK